MKYGELIDNSAIVITGCIRGNLDTYISELEDRILLNYNVYEKFNNIVVSYNKDNNIIKDNEFIKIRDLYKKYFPDCIFLSTTINRGWIFGGTDLLKNSYSYICDNMNVDYIWFLTEDFMIREKFLDIDFGDGDYDYFGLPFFGFGGIKNEDNDVFIEKYKTDTLLPQYNFQIIRSNSIKSFLMMESKEEDERYKNWVESGDGFDQRNHIIGTERQIYLTLKSNKLNYKMIVDDISILVDVVKKYGIDDGSYKNIFFMDYGLCHLSSLGEPVMTIEGDIVNKVPLNIIRN